MKYSDIKAGTNGTFTIGPISDVPDISKSGTSEPATWFLGTRAENRELLETLIQEALDHIYRFRETFIPGDPPSLPPNIKDAASYRAASQRILADYREFLEYLKTYATPFFSLRYQGHMLWDTTLPSMAGYFAAMLHNPNNVSIQASTTTTPLALLVGWDLCRMLGFSMGPDIEPWSHITADGSIANIEAAWAARESKFLPFAVRAALRSDDEFTTDLEAARDIELSLCDGTRIALRQADNWQLSNIAMDEALALPARIARLCGIADVFEVWDRLLPFTVNGRGWTATANDALAGLGGAPVLLAPSSKHYSWPKAAAVCGYGARGVIDIFVDAEARMDLSRLDRALSHCLEHRIPVSQVIAVIGSTEESAVDPLASILALREQYRKRGLDFPVHADAAWGGYAVTALRRDYRLVPGEPEPGEPLFIDDTSQIPASDYVIDQIKSIRLCDSATVDPHKWGYVPYPAGSVIYRNGALRPLTTFLGAYIGGLGSVRPEEPSVGVFGLEGSKPGASAASVYMSHRCIRPSVSGYGKLVNACLFNTRNFYARLLCLNTNNDNFLVIPLPRLPAERKGGDARHELRQIREHILGKTNADILKNEAIMPLFRALGPDLNILDYAFNFRRQDGSVNTDVAAFNALNDAVYDAFHIRFEQGQVLDEQRFILTKTSFDRNEYGSVFVDTFAARIGLRRPIGVLNCLRSVIMDPYIDQTEDGSFFDDIIGMIRVTISRIVASRFT